MTDLLDAPRLAQPGAPPGRLGVTRAAVLRRRTVTLVALAVVLGLAGWRALAFPGEVVNSGGLALLDDLLERALSPRLDAEFLEIVARATATTVAFAAVGAAGALVVGLLGGLVLSDAAWSRRPPLPVRALRSVLRGVLVAARSVHELVWALLLVGVLGLDPLVAVLALVVPFGAQTAQVYAETFDGVRGGAHAALRRSGAPRTAAVLYALVPSASPLLLSYAFYRFECSLRSTVLLGFVGVGGLGQELVVSLQSRNWEEVWTLVLALLVLSALVEGWSARVRREAGALGAARPPADTADAEGVGALAATRVESAPPKRTWTRWSVLLGLPGLAVAWWWTGATVEGLTDPLTWQLTQELVADLVRPELPDGGASVLLLAVLDTLAMAVLAMAGAVLLTLLLAPWAAAPVTPGRPVRRRRGRSPGRCCGWSRARSCSGCARCRRRCGRCWPCSSSSRASCPARSRSASTPRGSSAGWWPRPGSRSTAGPERPWCGRACRRGAPACWRSCRPRRSSSPRTRSTGSRWRCATPPSSASSARPASAACSARASPPSATRWWPRCSWPRSR